MKINQQLITAKSSSKFNTLIMIHLNSRNQCLNQLKVAEIPPKKVIELIQSKIS